MSQQSCFILNWNVRGLNNPAKRDNIKLLVDDMKATIVCLQETKIEYVSDSIVSQTLGGGGVLLQNMLSFQQMELEVESCWLVMTIISASQIL